MSIIFEMLKYTNPPFPPGVLAMKTPHPGGFQTTSPTPGGFPGGPISPSPGVQTLGVAYVKGVCNVQSNLVTKC